MEQETPPAGEEVPRAGEEVESPVGWAKQLSPFVPFLILFIIGVGNYFVYKFLTKKEDKVPEYIKEYKDSADGDDSENNKTSEEMTEEKKKEAILRRKQTMLFHAITQGDVAGINSFDDEFLNVRILETHPALQKPDGKLYSVTPILHALSVMKLDALEALLRRGQDPNEPGHFCNKMVARPLTGLAALQKVPPALLKKALTLLIENGADLNAIPAVKGTCCRSSLG